MTPRLLLFSLLATAVFAQDAKPIRGFSNSTSQAQRSLEVQLLATPQPSNVREYIRVMSDEPHHTGSEASNRVAAYILEKFRSWGLDADYHEFAGLMPTPKKRALELLAPEHYVAKLAEPAIVEDKDSADPGGLPTYNAYSPDGDIEGQVVYVNYGMPDDYERLESMGVSVEGKIVLARYMGGWRGIKPKVAAEHGAIGCIIFSDPKDDGFYQGDVYPEGPWRPEWGVQRGSMMDMPTYPGDPLSPGWGHVPGGRQLALSEAKTLPKIPVLPISWGDALPILRNLRGQVAPEAWRGAAPATYHVGPGPALVRMQTEFDWAVPTGRNVIARIEGSEFPDEWVIYGNHHDAWVNGATDPVSGNAALMETARALAVAVKAGWKPKRTIILASWDAEEWGLIGSTEWGEQFADEIQDKAVVYFNTDSNLQGVMSLQGSHTLERFLNDVARAIPDPKSGRSVWEEIKADKMKEANAEEKKELDSRLDLRIGALGSGSDYTVFIDHLAIASTNSSFRGDGGGVYHSVYDSFDWYRKFGDPEFTYGRAMAQFHAVAIARMADAQVLPFEFTNFADTIGVYLGEIEKLDQAKGVDLKELRPALQRLTAAAQSYEQAYDKAARDGFRGNAAKLNAILRKMEQSMARPEGLPDREWFQHHVYAPGFYTGYGVKTIPGVREALEQKLPERAQEQAARFAQVLDAVSAQIQAAEAELKRL
ncbi:MAG: M28 family metallopeptidase [Bryobacterales bacterium]